MYDLPGVDVSWICDLDEDRLARYGRRYPATTSTTQIDDLLGDDDLDAILIATPIFTHADLARRSLEAGKHTFVEKPLAPSSREADDLIDLAAGRDLTLMCGQTFLYSPPVRTLKEYLDRGDLGRIFFISSSRVNLGLHQRDVSVIWDLAPHDFSILLYWLGEVPETVAAVGRDSIVPGIPDVVFITLRFPSGIVCNVELSWLAPSKLRRTVVVGSEKMAVYDDVSPEPIRLFDHGVVYEDPETFGEYHLSYRTGDIVSPRIDTAEPLGTELGDFVASIRAVEEGRHLKLSADVVRMVEAAERSLENGGAPVALVERAER
jgi:predicted dehydrogenase